MNRAYKGFLALILAVTLALGIAPSALASSFSRQSYMIVATKYPNNAGTVTGEGLYRAGQTVTVTAEPSVDWGFFGGFDGWYENGERVTTDKSYSFTATGDRILQARFSFIHDIILMHGEGGTVSGGGSSYSENASLTVRAVPNDGYVFGGWYENGIKASDNANYTFVVMGSRTLEARFVQNQRITVNSARGGSAAGGGSFHSGERITVNAVPDSGYQFDGWYANGQRVSTSASYSFEVTAAITLEARFSTRSYQISVTSGTGGTVSGGGTFTQNQQVSVSATSSGSGYIFDGWYEGGARVSSSQNYSFTATANRNLEARFTAVESISILTTAQPWQGGTVTGGGSYKPGDTVTLRAIPNDYYLFDGWWESGQRVSTS
ncbi:MAG: InlB B-repeat-containing protein, partial [Clostridiales bacterium]|nr:InlB B-repeat-containing protein [Clostridiales bacterium]